MKKLPVILSFLLLFLFPVNSFAQDELTEDKSFPTKIFEYLSELNNQIESFFTKEKAGNLNRNLQYFKTDLKTYLVVRKNLLDTLDAYHYNVNHTRVKPVVAKLTGEWEKLHIRLHDLDAYVQSVIPASDTTIGILNGVLMAQRQLFLSQLTKLLSGQEVNKTQLKTDAKDLHKKLSRSVDLIDSMQHTLRPHL
jgi:hypothetical protein